MNGMSFEEKKVFTIPNIATVKAITIYEDNWLLVTESLNATFSQLVSILMLFTLSYAASLKFSIARNLIGHSNFLKVPR